MLTEKQNKVIQATRTMNRAEVWLEAYDTFIGRAGSATFLYGTHFDRQTGATGTHRFREAMGVHYPAPNDGAQQWTSGVDKQTRYMSWNTAQRRGPSVFVPMAERLLHGTYRPKPLLICRFVQAGRTKPREIAVPTVEDRVMSTVLLEVLTPIIDPVLSDRQHGYRSSFVAGRRVRLPDLQNIARGSTAALATRLFARARAGAVHLAEADITNAFMSVNRELLLQALQDDQCPVAFAKLIIRCLGDDAVDPEQGGKIIPVTGIPLGNPCGPLLFNFYVRRLHLIDLGPVDLFSYADNFFFSSKTEEALDQGVEKFLKVLRQDFCLDAQVEQKWNPQVGEKCTFKILEKKDRGGMHILVEGQGVVRLRRMGSKSLPHGGRGPDSGVCPQDGLGTQAGDEPVSAGCLPAGEHEEDHLVPVSPEGVGVRTDAARGGHRPNGVRYNGESTPGQGNLDPDTAAVQLAGQAFRGHDHGALTPCAAANSRKGSGPMRRSK
jgi:hypothetical protein